MRPRVFPAEDLPAPRSGCRRGPRFNEAAGIPRGRHVSPSGSRVAGTRFNEAAGIPRGRRGRAYTSRCCLCSFNEAAGIPRGRRQLLEHVPRGLLASMRPRVFPAEDAAVQQDYYRKSRSFNEAAGIPRGRRS